MRVESFGGIAMELKGQYESSFGTKELMLRNFEMVKSHYE